MAFSRLRTKIDSWKICHRPILAVYLKKISSVGKDQVNSWEFCVSKITPIVCFCSVSTLFSSCQRQRTLRLLFGDCRSFYFHSLMKLNFLASNGYCVYMINKIIHGCLKIWNFSTHIQLSISLIYYNHLWAIKLNTWREIPHLCMPMYYSLFLPWSTCRIFKKIIKIIIIQ